MHKPSKVVCITEGRRKRDTDPQRQSRGSGLDFPKAGGSFPLDFHRGDFGSKSSTTFQGFQITGFTVRCAILPTTKEDANPFIRESSYDGVSGFAFRALLLVVLFRPSARSERMDGPFLKRLPQKLRTGPAPMDPTLFAAPGEQ